MDNCNGTMVQHFFDGYPNLGASLLTFAPIKNQFPGFKCVQQISGGSFDLLPVRITQFNLRIGSLSPFSNPP